jgi:2-desacetyl-2-hydroxyethyl bacteriochlorophyllide A dehydrogenase
MEGLRIVWPAPKQVELASFEIPSPKPFEVLIETEYSVISAGTERANLTSMPNTSQQFPQLPGYSAVGRIIETGAEVSNVQAGDRVICYHTGHTSHAVKPAEGLVKIEDRSISLKEAAFVVIASMSLQGVRKARLELGESVMIMGQGLLGLFAVQLAQFSGGLPVIAADLNESETQVSAAAWSGYCVEPVR